MLLAGCGSNGSEQPPTLSDDSLYATFRDPGNEWRGKPFWSWNGRLEKDELIRQLHVFKEMGMGGAFLHSRVGLKTEYLGPEWFDLTNAVVDEAARLGMEAYLYDEDRWPSGSAGGMVTVDTSLRMKYLILETMPAEQFEWNDEGIVSAFACDLNGIDYSNLQRLNPASNMADYAGKTVLKFAQRTCPESDVYNGTTYLDVFNPKATERFIELTHEQYRKHCGERIGTTIEGIFTDEPHRGGLFSTFGAVSTYACPWALSLPQEYEKMFGGDLTADLPKLFLRENGERVNDVKWKFCELTQSLFLKNFAKPQYDWCTEHDMAYTGHVLHENNLTSQVTMQGSLMLSMVSLKSWRSSALSIVSGLAPSRRTPICSKKPSLANCMERVRPVWPPKVESRLSGRSFSIMRFITGRVKGSIYMRSAMALSVIMVAGLELTRTTSRPSSLSARQA